jgi:TonB family protein
MKPGFLSIAFILIAFNSWAQQVQQKKEEAPVKYSIVEEMPEFPGGEKEMENFIRQNLKPVCTAGRVYVDFYIDTTGTVQEARVLRGLSPECDKEALRLIQSMPKWKPGRQNGRAVNVYHPLPVDFGNK